VRNRRDGSVEAVFSGSRDDVDAVIEACRHGPFSARVSELDQREGTEADLLDTAEGGSSFSMRPTA
jgi:acylphosphatase